MIYSDDHQTRNRADINQLEDASATLANAVTGIWAVVESQQELIRMLDMRVSDLERRPRWWRKRR